MNPISAIIPSRNGRDLLAQCIPALERALRPGDEIIVVDDGSTDGSAEFLRRRHPRVRVVRVTRSRGFGDLCNLGMRLCYFDLALLLNNDMVVAPDSLEPLIAALAAPGVFAVGPQYRMRRGIRDGYRCSICGGIHREGIQYHGPGIMLDAPAGGGLFDRRMFWELGGFDPLYLPFYWEDTDLGYRAWRAGLRIRVEPASVMYHEHGATISRLQSRHRAEATEARNSLLFTWKNARDIDVVLRHLWRLPRRMAADILNRNGAPGVRGLAAALRRMPRALAARAAEGAGLRSDAALARAAVRYPRLFLDRLA
ncbi:MAG: glycosyltransferase family 2 protein [Armatimonadota bacterium]|nr:MAG: glycosyltransferase family 2 protein [Armatimonadota bacterium]